MKNDSFEEKLAELCHEQWSGWMEYLFNKTYQHSYTERPKESGGIMSGEFKFTAIPEWAVERWQRQMNTPYKDLSEKEKESDRIEARKFIELIERYKNENN